jgi:predicted methyltransferase
LALFYGHYKVNRTSAITGFDMKHTGLILCFLALACGPLFAGDLVDAINSPHRLAANVERDSSRHPAETLTFFKLEPDQTVVEIWPGGGWYTEILAPYLKPAGTFYAAHFPLDTDIPYFKASRRQFEQMLAADPGHYSEVNVVDFEPGRGILSVPEGSADRVLTFRNVHNWLRTDSGSDAFALFFKVLKSGGMLGVVEHRTRADESREWMLENGYMNQDYVIKLAEDAGFTLLASSEINANPNDTANHPAGVWTLPPRLKLEDQDRAKYQAIGESDRMTLLFIKP